MKKSLRSLGSGLLITCVVSSMLNLSCGKRQQGFSSRDEVDGVKIVTSGNHVLRYQAYNPFTADSSNNFNRLTSIGSSRDVQGGSYRYTFSENQRVASYASGCSGSFPCSFLPASGYALEKEADRKVGENILKISRNNQKLLAPISIDLLRGKTSRSGDVTVSVVSTPDIDGKSIDFRVVASDGLGTLNNSDLEWTTPAKKGENNIRKVLLRATGPGEQRFVVFATLVLDNDDRQTAIQTFVLNSRQSNKPSSLEGLNSESKRAISPSAGKIIEIPASSIPK